ncbi:hypothetical protein O6H91_01G123200 [Diphasiastrum complanatum]|uniref:Uncharacterized protein n=1 Tax=Diphasiastrum complanatum TaxID=34168 RepID=A0ACC2EVG5_DIPCM|nr:hypothetical protein O6H91_01G123200 [Diphasiastrum complanatum]
MATIAPLKRWIKPEVYPLFLTVGTAVGLCGFMIVRNLSSHPDVRIDKEGRAAGLLENYREGKQYKDHAVRRFVSGHKPEIMPGINKYFSGGN